MNGQTLLAQFTERPQHDPYLVRVSIQRLQRCAQRSRIGIIGVIDDGVAQTPTQRLHAAGDGFEAFQALLDALQIDVELQGHGGRSQCIFDVMQTRQGQFDAYRLLPVYEFEAGLEASMRQLTRYAGCAHHRIVRESKRHDMTRFSQCQPQRMECVIPIQNRRTIEC